MPDSIAADIGADPHTIDTQVLTSQVIVASTSAPSVGQAIELREVETGATAAGELPRESDVERGGSVGIEQHPEHVHAGDRVGRDLGALQAMRPQPRYVDHPVETQGVGEAPAADVRRRRPLGDGPQRGRHQPSIVGRGAVGTHQPRAELQRPSQVVAVDRRARLEPDPIGAAEPGDEPGGAIGGREGNSWLSSPSKNPEQAAADLAHVVLGHAVELARQVIVVAVVGQTDGMGELGTGEPATLVCRTVWSHRYWIAGHASDPLFDLGCAADRWSVGADEMVQASATAGGRARSAGCGDRGTSPRMAKTLNSVGHTKLFTATPRVGNQNVTESSASDGAGITSISIPATVSVHGASNVIDGGTKPGVNGACAGSR